MDHSDIRGLYPDESGCTARQWNHHRELPQSTNAGFDFHHTAIGADEDSPFGPGPNFGLLLNALPPSILSSVDNLGLNVTLRDLLNDFLRFHVNDSPPPRLCEL